MDVASASLLSFLTRLDGRNNAIGDVKVLSGMATPCTVYNTG